MKCKGCGNKACTCGSGPCHSCGCGNCSNKKDKSVCEQCGNSPCQCGNENKK